MGRSFLWPAEKGGMGDATSRASEWKGSVWMSYGVLVGKLPARTWMDRVAVGWDVGVPQGAITFPSTLPM
jgi:hypothetical protein